MTEDQAATREPEILTRLRNHFGDDPGKLPVLIQSFENYERANLHLAVDEIRQEADQFEIIGLVVPEHHYSVSLSRLCTPSTAGPYVIGPVEYVDVPVAGDQSLSCVKRGLHLLQLDGPIALLLHQEQYTPSPAILAEVMAPGREAAEDFVGRLTRLTRFGKAVRGHVLSLAPNRYGGLALKFHRLPRIERSQIVLPERILERIELHSIRFSSQASRLRASGRHLKRGILLHGLPGTGKTLSAMYLATRMTERTVLLLSGSSMGYIEQACHLARMLQPATIILEDVDLIGSERDRQMVGANALLLELLNQMDGLAEDCDVLFVLTTNRPDILEPALAARPGRVDLAIEIELPDEACRRRLIHLYGKGLELELENLDSLVQRTSGASPAFIRELLRKAALLASLQSEAGPITVRDEHLEQSLAELLVGGGDVTRALLGMTKGGARKRHDETKNSD